ncbi:hypothetical protein PTKU15_17430 [Paraburkholderia terrae]|nr:hypothetical protein PTKU15_17430 [Paraburkholderia terrae]
MPAQKLNHTDKACAAKHPTARQRKKKIHPIPGLIPAQTKLHANHLALDFPCNMQKNRRARPARSHLHGTARQHNNEVTV